MSIFFSVRFGLLNSCLVSLLDTFICELYNLVTLHLTQLFVVTLQCLEWKISQS